MKDDGKIILMYDPKDDDQRPLPERIIVKLNGNMDYIDKPGKRLYRVRDWVYYVSGSKAKKMSLPWSKLKRTLIEEKAIRVSDFVESIRVETSGGKQPMDYTDEQGIYLITQRMSDRSDTVRDVKNYLAAAGVFVDAMARDRRKYLRMGRSESWIEVRIQGKVTRNQFTDALTRAILNTRDSIYWESTETVYKTLWERTTAELRNDLSIGKKETPRNHMGEMALMYTMMVERVCTKQFNDRYVDSVPYVEAMHIIRKIATVFHRQAHETSQLMGIDLVTERPLPDDPKLLG